MRIAALSAISLSPSVAWRFAALFSSTSESSSLLTDTARIFADFRNQGRKAMSGNRPEQSALVSAP